MEVDTAMVVGRVDNGMVVAVDRAEAEAEVEVEA